MREDHKDESTTLDDLNVNGNTRQVPVRLHVDDYKLMKSMLVDDDLSYQKFTEFCIQAYIDGDPHLLLVLKKYKGRYDVPREKRNKALLSYRDRTSILDELEKNEGNK